MQDHHVPVRVLGVGGRPECRRHRPSDLGILRERHRRVGHQVLALGVHGPIVLVETQLQLARIHQKRCGISRIVGVLVRRLLRRRRGVERAVLSQIEVGPHRPRKWPLVFFPPRVVADDEEIERRLRIHAVVEPFDEVVEPPELQRATVDSRLRPELAVHVVDPFVRARIHHHVM